MFRSCRCSSFCVTAMAMRSQAVCYLALVVLLVGAAGVQGHASSKLRGILGRDAPGSGQTQ